ncbi:MAG: hypothetical protein ABEH59_01420 [Halobacteriales archaeon]
MDFRTTIQGRLARRSGRSVLDRLEGRLAAVAYWLAVGLPLAYLALLVTGIESTGQLGLFVGLLAVHGLALIGGRNYHPGSARSEPW